MTLAQILKMTPAEFAKLTHAQKTEYLSQYFPLTRPTQQRKTIVDKQLRFDKMKAMIDKFEKDLE